MQEFQNIIIIKHGEGEPPSEVLQPSELGFDTIGKKLYIGHEDGIVCLNENTSGGGGTGSSEAVLYIEQNLSEEQQLQARSNIGAADVKAIEELNGRIEDIINPFEFSISAQPSIGEVGQEIEEISFTWNLTRVPAEIFLDEYNYVTEKRGTFVLNKDNRDYFPIKENKTWITKAKLENGKEILPNSQPAISFCFPLYYGAVGKEEIEAAINEPDKNKAVNNLIKTLIADRKIFKKLTNGVSLTFAPGADNTQVAFYALPSDRKTPVFSANGFDGGFSLIDSMIPLENDYEIKGNYNIWTSINTGFKTTTINVR